ncbi:hypothetical protein Patl1_22188 [Pistacia atlantica]|uniref:Uncharacterized protein n=1 Tax=Pistacia atlantica TaxID=434234 RepID=A0ACC1BJZ3_9ROSI|nr:hypothetical protein Patl1_22188 [Pistacia atlantica]
MDIEGNIQGRQRRLDVIWSDVSCFFTYLFSSVSSFFTDLFSSINSFFCQGYKLLCEHKKRALAVLFVMLETLSLVLDVFGQSCWEPEYMLRSNLGWWRLASRLVRLIATFLPVLGIKMYNDYAAPVLLLVFAIIAAVFTFTKDDNIHVSSVQRKNYENELPIFWCSRITSSGSKSSDRILVRCYPEDADNKLLHGANDRDNKLNMGVTTISVRGSRKVVDRKSKQETKMYVENAAEEKKSK